MVPKKITEKFEEQYNLVDFDITHENTHHGGGRKEGRMDEDDEDDDEENMGGRKVKCANQ